jgi:hypothetical protein
LKLTEALVTELNAVRSTVSGFDTQIEELQMEKRRLAKENQALKKKYML